MIMKNSNLFFKIPTSSSHVCSRTHPCPFQSPPPHKFVKNKNSGGFNMKCRSLLFLFLMSIFILSFVPNVSSIGITPGRMSLNFEPNLEKQVSFSVLNSANKEMSVVFMVKGELAEWVTLSETYSEFSSSEESKSFSYTVNMPSKLDSPGSHLVEIVAMEAPKNIKEKGTFVGATVAVISQLEINVPYPNKYVESELNVVESQGEIFFSVPVINRGRLDIEEIGANVDIYTISGEKIKSISTEKVSVLSGKRKELVARWNYDVNPGRYRAVVTIEYDDEITTILDEFNIGEMFLEILDVAVRDFKLGGIAKFNTYVENKWSSDLKDVYLNIVVYNEYSEVMADFKSPTVDVDSLGKAELVAYWDTTGVREGVYDGKIVLNYGNRVTEKEIELEVSDDAIEVIGITGHVVVKEDEGIGVETILIILVVILIIVNVIILLRRKKG